MTLKAEIESLKYRINRLSSIGGSCQLSFEEWLSTVNPELRWDWPHMVYIIYHLGLMSVGKIKKLMIFLPPRHAKTSLVTVRYTAWRIVSEPTIRVILAAYNQELAARFSRYVRRHVQDWVQLNNERTAVVEWETVTGGGLHAAGVGSGVTGIGADLVVIDDPVKSREEVRSEAYRERVWDWYSNDIYTRLEPDAAIILIMTRWHDDDLAGRILASADAENWAVVSLPAEAEENDPLNRTPGQPLWPERYDSEALAESRIVLGNNYFALYQQRPVAREGELFKRFWFVIVESAPVQANRVRYWDKAGSAGTGAYTCGVLMARSRNGIYYIEDVVRGQWSAGVREKIIRQTAELDRQRYGRVSIWIEQEPGSGGKESAEASIRNLAGFAVRAERATGDKIVRAEPFAAQCEAGNVRLVKGPWNAAYLDELTAFPFGKYSDQVDGSSGAFNKPVSNFSEFVRQSVMKHPDRGIEDIMARIDRAYGQQLVEETD